MASVIRGRESAEESSLNGPKTIVLVGAEAVGVKMASPGPKGTLTSPEGSGDAEGSSSRPGRSAPSLRRHLVIGDMVAVAVAWTPQALVDGGRGLSTQVACAAAAGATTIVAMQRAGLYRARVCAVRSLEAVRVLAAAVLGALVFAGCQWLALAGISPFGFSAVARPVEGGAAAAAAVLVLRWRFGRWLKMQRATGRFLRTVVLVGTNDDAVAVWDLITQEPELGYLIGAVAGEERPDAPWNEVPTCSDLAQLGTLAAKAGASGVIIVGHALGAGATSAAVDRALAAGLHVQVWPGLAGLAARRIRMAPVLGVPVFYVEPRGGLRWQWVVKRVMDVTLTLALLPLVLPVLLLAAILVKLEDRGPVIYHHRVVGRFGVPLTVLKLRTMVPNAAQMIHDVAGLNERTGGPLFKASYDPRVTRVGRLLRATSVDELPQLWNVLNGTMSLVGPRFALPAEVEQFDDELRRRHEMRPGITGLWQSEARDNPSFGAYRRLDLFYVDNWSLSLDVAILINTLHQIGVKALRTLLSAVVHRRAVGELATRER